MSVFGDAALEYIRLGFPVFPVHLDKTPLTPHGFKDASIDPDVIRAWWEKYPNAGIGIQTGADSGFIVLDEDPRHGGTESLNALTAEFGAIPDGPVSRTGGGGRHFFFSHPGGTVPNAAGLRPGLDLRGDGGYIVVPPSPHPSGKTYEWIRNITDAKLPMVPGWLFRLLDEKKAPGGRKFPLSQGRIPHGQHHDYIISTAASFASRIAGIDEETLTRKVLADIRESLDDWGSHEREVPDAVRSALLKYGHAASVPPPAGPTVLPPTTTRPSSPAAGWSVDATVGQSEAHLMKDDLRHKLLQLPLPDGIPPLWNTVGEGSKAREEANRVAFIEALGKNYSFVTLRDTEEVLFYDQHGLYNGGGIPFIREWTELQHKVKGRTATQRFVAETVDSVKRSTYLERDSLNPPGRLCLANGVLELDAVPVVKHDHTAKEHFTFRLPVTYDANAECPQFLAFLAEILPEPDKRDVVQEMFGYCLRPGNPFKLAFFLVGKHDSGKSTLLEILRGLLGDENTSTIALQSLADNRFASAGLFGRLANIYTDLSPKLIKDVGLFKMLTGGSDHVPAERKFQAPFSFVNPAKLIFSANALPAVPWGDDAFFRRWLTLEFTVQVPPEKQIPFLEAKLLTEASGILNWALAGLERLLSRRRFPDTGSVSETRVRWRRLSDSLAWFAEEGVVRERGAWVGKTEFYAAYAEFCEDHGVQARTTNDVGIELPQLLPGVHATVVKSGGRTGRSVRAWMGLKLKEHGLDADISTTEDPRSTRSTRSTPFSGITPTRVKGGVMLEQGVEQVEHVEQEPSGHDPEDLFDGRPTRADSARERLPEAVETSSDGSDNASETTPWSADRKVHENCPLCRDVQSHICYACNACRWQEAHGGDEQVG
jgi:putative DNA primase/helicase